jgi:peroxiredoxin Q/BCP
MIALIIALCGGASGAAAGPSVGDAAPDFTLSGTDGVEHHLRDYVGKQAVVVAWFPKAFTPG